MTYFGLKFYVGPCAVKQAADAVRRTHHVMMEGTEHVYVSAFAETFTEAVAEVIAAARKTNDGMTFGLRADSVVEVRS